MKHLTLLLMLFTVAASSYAQAPHIQWQKPYGGTAADDARCVRQTADSGYIIVGAAGSSNGDITSSYGGNDFWVVRTTPTGGIVWQKNYGGSLSEAASCIQVTSDGGYIVVGSCKSNDRDVTGNHGMHDIWVVKLTATGSITWQKSIGGSDVEQSHYIEQTADGGYIIAGNTASSNGDVAANHGGDDIWIVKLTSTGAISWEKTFGGSSDEAPSTIHQTADGGYIVFGQTESNDGDVSGNHGGGDYWLFKITSTGGLSWQVCLGGSGDEENAGESGNDCLQITPAGEYVVAGWSNSTDGDVTGNHGSFDYWVLKLTSTGGIIWEKSLGGTGDDEGTSVQLTPSDGGCIVTGLASSNDGDVTGNHGVYDAWIVKLSTTGTLLWQKAMGGTGPVLSDCANSIKPTFDSGYIVAGFSNSNDGDVSGGHGQYDFWVVKLSFCQLPDAGSITGATTVCVGSTINLSDTALSGVWSASNTNASVAAGTVTGVAAGASIIRYIITNSCGADTASTPITIKATPTPVITVTGHVLSTTSTYITYQWELGGATIAGATNATYTYTVNGTYTVKVTDTSGCAGTSAAMNIINVGIDEVSSSRNVMIVPNPTTDEVAVIGSTIEPSFIRVYNTIGQEMKKAENVMQLSIAELPAGMYFIRLYNSAGHLTYQQIVNKL